MRPFDLSLLSQAVHLCVASLNCLNACVRFVAFGLAAASGPNSTQLETLKCVAVQTFDKVDRFGNVMQPDLTAVMLVLHSSHLRHLRQS